MSAADDTRHSDDTPPHENDPGHRIDRLLDAIELLKADERDEALAILRGLIQEDKDFEYAWLWMSVAVRDINQSIVCLENVLRINPDNMVAAGALYRLRSADMQSEHYRAKLRSYRDTALITMWLLILGLMVAIFATMSSAMLTDSSAAVWHRVAL
jgi:tetratricopeptide (TPR) repeat protein